MLKNEDPDDDLNLANLLEIKNLSLGFQQDGEITKVLDDVNLELKEQEILVLAGESGSGKSLTALCIVNILPKTARIISGEVNFSGKNLLSLTGRQLTAVRGRDIAYIFQEPASFFNPVYTIGEQIVETIMLHQPKNKTEARDEAVALLISVKIDDFRRVLNSYPHQLSGGMNQRAFIAMALACRPKILIADEPTTSLDVTIEAQIISLLLDLRRKFGFSMLFITHNFSIAGKIADRIAVMYKGRIVEQGTNRDIFLSPGHAHTRELIAAYQKVGRL